MNNFTYNGEAPRYVGPNFVYGCEKFIFKGRTYKNCDPSSAQKSALAADQSWQKVLTNSYSTVFGAGSKMFDSLSRKLDSIISTTQGYSPEELAAKNSQALNNAAAAEKAVQAKIGERAAMTSATPGVESGVVQSERAAADTSIMENLGNEQAKITEGNYATGRAERDQAIKSEEALPGAAFGPAEGFGGEIDAANNTVDQQANSNAQASNSWMGLVGGLADQATRGLTSPGGFLNPKKNG